MQVFEPTMNLRFVVRDLAELEAVNPVTYTGQAVRVLQQAWIDKRGSGAIEWRTVPLVARHNENSQL